MRKQAEVICQHTIDKKIIPLRVRVPDEDDVMQTYNIKGYKPINAKDTYTMPNEVVVAHHIKNFQCKIVTFGVEKIIGLMYNQHDGIWYVDY